MGGITFVTLHVVGSNNGRGRTSEGDAEFAARTAADIAWMREGFAAAKQANHRALMIIQQANIFPDFPPFPGGGPKEPSGYTELRDALKRKSSPLHGRSCWCTATAISFASTSRSAIAAGAAR